MQCLGCLGSSPCRRGLGRLKRWPEAALAEDVWRIIGRGG